MSEENNARELSRILRIMSKAFERNNLKSLKQLSKKAIKLSCLKNFQLLAEASVISYALYKLLSKKHYIKSNYWLDLKKEIIKELVLASKNALKDLKETKKNLKAISKEVIRIDKKVGYYFGNLIEKARVKQASTAYSFGLSLSKAASLTETNERELMHYIGYTKMHDEIIEEKEINERIKYLLD